MSSASLTSPPESSLDPAEFVSGTAARQILGGCGWYRLLHACVTGEVRTYVRPGSTIRYHQGDLERLARAGYSPYGLRRVGA